MILRDEILNYKFTNYIDKDYRDKVYVELNIHESWGSLFFILRMTLIFQNLPEKHTGNPHISIIDINSHHHISKINYNLRHCTAPVTVQCFPISQPDNINKEIINLLGQNGYSSARDFQESFGNNKPIWHYCVPSVVWITYIDRFLRKNNTRTIS